MITEMVGREWRLIDEFPGYEVSNAGTVRNCRTKRVLSIFVNKNNTPYVAFSRQGKQFNKSLPVLVAEIFLPAPEKETFTTPIHLNGDRTDCAAHNLMWRPRWFAIEFHKQFEEVFNGERSVVRVSPPGLTLTAKQASMKYGLLLKDIINAATTQDEARKLVWPTLQRFNVVFRN